MRHTVIFFAFTLMLMSPLTLHAQAPTFTLDMLAGKSREEQIQLLLQIIALIQQQRQESRVGAAVASSEWHYVRPAAKDEHMHDVDEDDELYDEEEIIHQYLVRNDRLYENDEWTRDTTGPEYEVWRMFRSLFGKEFIADNLWRYATFDVGDVSTLAFVQYLKQEEPNWGLAVNTNSIDLDDKVWTRDLAVTLIHEYAHMLTLANNQVNHRLRSADVCARDGTYFMPVGGEGCTKSKSYLNVFVEEFWNDASIKKAAQARALGKTKDLYAANEDVFVTWYAATSPEEDIAESFTNFILERKPTSDEKVRDQKILFFYEYPALVTLREEIRDAAEEYFK